MRWGAAPEATFDLGLCGNTHDEAVRMRELMQKHGWKRIFLVTSASHMRRAEGVFAKAGVPVVPVACDFQALGTPPSGLLARPFPGLAGMEQLDLYLHEKIGWWVYRWRGWI
jgi:uncharacterized SAM-binding protein YcdF (DUF218 family)